jgi:hypothetical protein
MCIFNVQDKYVRIVANVFLLATTEKLDQIDESLPAARQNIGVRITYIASVNPGGWAPPAAVQFD